MSIITYILLCLIAYQAISLILSKKARQDVMDQFKLPGDVFYESEKLANKKAKRTKK